LDVCQTVKAPIAEVETEIGSDHAQVDDIEDEGIINGLADYARCDAEDISTERKDDKHEALVLAGTCFKGLNHSGWPGQAETDEKKRLKEVPIVIKGQVFEQFHGAPPRYKRIGYNALLGQSGTHF
jgi:hypothetical protein